MFIGTDSHLYVHKCFPHYQNMMECADGTIFKRKLCAPYVYDYLECADKRKLVASDPHAD